MKSLGTVDLTGLSWFCRYMAFGATNRGRRGQVCSKFLLAACACRRLGPTRANAWLLVASFCVIGGPCETMRDPTRACAVRGTAARPTPPQTERTRGSYSSTATCAPTAAETPPDCQSNRRPSRNRLRNGRRWHPMSTRVHVVESKYCSLAQHTPGTCPRCALRGRPGIPAGGPRWKSGTSLTLPTGEVRFRLARLQVASSSART